MRIAPRPPDFFPDLKWSWQTGQPPPPIQLQKTAKRGGGDGTFWLDKGELRGVYSSCWGGWVGVEACASLPAMTNAKLQKKISIECNDCSLRPYSTLTICFCCCKTTSCYCWISKLPYTDTILAHLANYVVV